MDVLLHLIHIFFQSNMNGPVASYKSFIVGPSSFLVGLTKLCSSSVVGVCLLNFGVCWYPTMVIIVFVGSVEILFSWKYGSLLNCV
jgi:hypothetical protein